MRLDYIFFFIGAILLISTIIYFSYEYVFNLPKEIKSIILILLLVVFFVLGEYLRERDL